MIPDRKILSAIRSPQASRYVSLERNDRRRISVRTEEVNTERLRELAGQIRQSERGFLESIAKRNESLEAFLHDKHISPSPENNLDLKPYLQADVLRFTVSGLVPKALNPNKTDQSLPDLGDMALLIHFDELAKVAEQRYGKPVEFTFLTEGNYAREVLGFDPEKVRAFNEGIKFFSEEIVGVGKQIKLRDWYDAVSALPGYHDEYAAQRANMQRQLANDPSLIEKEFLGIIPTIYMTIQPVSKDIRSIYSLRRSEATRRQIEAATKITLNIMAWNRAREKCGDRKSIFQGQIYGSLNPGPGKFGFYAIGPWNELAPHHGVGILDTESGKVSILHKSNIRERRGSKKLRTSDK